MCHINLCLSKTFSDLLNALHDAILPIYSMGHIPPRKVPYTMSRQDHGDGILMSKQNNVAETYRNRVAVTK